MAVDILSSLNKNGSGLNLRELTTSLVSAEIAPKQEIAQEKIDTAELSISALGQMRAQLETLDTALDVARSFNSIGINLSAPQIDATLKDTSAVEQSATIEVHSLAQSQTLEFSGFTSADDTFDGGTLTIDFGEWDSATQSQFTANTKYAAIDLEIAAGASLADVAAQITEVGGVAARVIDKGDGTFSLGLTSATGKDSALRLTVTPDASTGNDTALSTLDTSQTNATHQLQAATDAELSLDGIRVSRQTNDVGDLIDGVDLTLTQVTTAPIQLDIERDMNTTSVVVEELVFQLNSALSFINAQTNRGLDDQERGSLAGNVAAETVKRTLLNAISSGYTGFGERPLYLADFGIQTERDGSLTLDTVKMKRQYEADPKSFDALVQDGLKADVGGFYFMDTPALNASQSFAFERDGASGTATLNGAELREESNENGQTTYRVITGDLRGAAIVVEDGVNSANITYGRSFANVIQTQMRDAMDSSGVFTRQETNLADLVDDQKGILSDLEDRASTLERRYLAQFTAMETTISSLNSTGEYLTNLVAQWNKDS